MNIVVSPLSHIDAVLRQYRPSDVMTLMSPDAETPDFSEWPDVRALRLGFNDISEQRDGLVAPNVGHIGAILDFSRTAKGRGALLIHCLAGISRSAAAAYIVACDRAEPGAERILARRLRRASPSCTPNPLMIAIADETLQRDGRMVAAIADIGRGAFAREGRPFKLTSPGRADELK